MVLWPTVAKQAGRWYRGVVKAADGLMARWHTVEVDKSWLPHAHEDAKKGEKEKGGARGGRGAAQIPLTMNAEKDGQIV